ncbi:MAG: outer membrane beta-barrel protein [Cyanobacteria bacterium P01_F01_bin.3]
MPTAITKPTRAIGIFAATLSALSIGVASTASAATTSTGPAFIAWGPVAVTPTLGTDVKYSDNIYLQEDDTTESWIFVARPEVNFKAQDRENIYQFDYKGEAAWYQEDSTNDRNDYFDNTFSADAYILPAERWTLTGFASFAMLHEDRGTGLTEGEIGRLLSKPVRYDQTDFGGSLEYGSGIGRLELTAGYMDREYQNFRDFTRTRDLEQWGFGATFFYPIAPKTDLLLDYTYDDFHYPNAFEDRPSLDSKQQSLQGGITWEISPNLESRAQIGYVDKDFNDPGRQDWDGIGWSLSLQIQPREQDIIKITGVRSPEETSLQGDFVNRETLTIDWEHLWSDRFSTTVSLTGSREKYEGSFDDRDDDIYNFVVRGDYTFRRWCVFFVEYNYNDRNSNADTLSYSENVFQVGANLSL